MGKVFLFLIALLLPAMAWAHTLERQGSVGVVMHVNPGDNPIAGSPSDIFFEFRDRDEAFSLASCICTATIVDDSGKVVASIALPSPEPLRVATKVTFPDAGVYTVRLVGVPIRQDMFTPFSVEYVVRASHPSAPSSIKVLLSIGGCLMVFSGLGVLIYRLSR